ncbi:MAG: hypothetical protein WC495_07215 [Patescibacteria group bacterium]|jgi:hypothetical protein
MKFKISEEKNIYHGNHMVDLPGEWGEGGDIDEFAIKEDAAEGCKYRKFYKGDYFCTYGLPSKGKNQEEIEQSYEDGDGNITVCPDDIGECPIGRWTEQDFWSKDDWEDYHLGK